MPVPVEPEVEPEPSVDVPIIELPAPPPRRRVTATVTIGSGSELQKSQYVSKWVHSPEVHIIGLYDGGSSAEYSNPQGVFIPGTTQVNVRGRATRPVSLVLSAYEPTHWILKGSGVTSLESVVVIGYHESDAIGVDSSKVINRSGSANRWGYCGYEWQSQRGTCAKEVERHFGTPIASFTGIYSTSPKLGTVTSAARPAERQVNVHLR